MKKYLTKQGSIALGLLLAITLSATELDKGAIVFRDGKIYLDYQTELGTGTVAVYHSQNLRQASADWEFVGLRPISETLSGSFEITSYFRKDQPSGFFELRTQPFAPSEQFVWIPSGQFLLGSSEDEPNRYPDEGPQHLVKIDNGFWMSRYEVTQSEFEQLMRYNPSRATGHPRGPVENVSWFDAVRYCERLTQQAQDAGELPNGLEYRLPTEAEWEYACRAGSQASYSYGDDVQELSKHAWWAENTFGEPFDVGLLEPNAWGLYDMHGNVFEWCHSEYKAYPKGEIRARNVDYRVVRGGAFICPAEIVRSACRFESAPSTSRSWLTGFRVVLAKKEPLPSHLFEAR